jgi:hypothetical protein
MVDVLLSVWQSHWHCIVPALAIVVVALLQGLGKKNSTKK